MLHHVSLEIDPGEADRFAELLAVIGFDAVGAPAALGDAVRWFSCGDSQVHLILTEAASIPALGHSAFVVSELELALAELRGLGFEVAEARELWGERRAFVTLPGRSPDRADGGGAGLIDGTVPAFCGRRLHPPRRPSA